MRLFQKMRGTLILARVSLASYACFECFRRKSLVPRDGDPEHLGHLGRGGLEAGSWRLEICGGI
jgi:hypothetical protein